MKDPSLSALSDITPVKRTKPEAARFYSGLSDFYGILAWPFERSVQLAGLRLLAPSNGDDALEIGFGPGHMIVQIARSIGPDGTVCGIDISRGMCQTARNRLARKGLLPRANLISGDAMRLPYAANSFDKVYIGFTLELFDTPEIPQVLAELRRVLRPGGNLAVVSLSRNQGPAWVVRLYEWLHLRLPRLIDCRPIHVRGSIEEAGFSTLSTEMKRVFGLPTELVVATRY